MYHVRNWMSSPPVLAVESAVLPEVRQLMRDRRVRRVPVVNSANELVGIVTEGDVNRISASHETDVREFDIYHRVADLPIGEVMTRNVITVDPELHVVAVAQLLLHHKIGGVPVVEGRRVVGMITESDLFRLLVTRGPQVFPEP